MIWTTRRPVLMLITDRRRSATPIVPAVIAGLADGVDLCLIRDPDHDEGETERLARQLLPHVAPDRLIVSGSVSVAVRLGLGLHILDGQSDPVADPSNPRVAGRSIHDPIPATPENHLRSRPEEPSRYFLAGNVWPSRTHPGRPGRGVDWLRSVVRSTDHPVLAVGGITERTAPDAIGTGCAGVAVIDAILADPDPAAATARLRRALDIASGGSTP